MSMLKELYNGNINPVEKYIKKGGEYQKINKLLVEDIDKLILKLNADEKKLLEKIFDEMSSLNLISETESFVYGFCLGSQLILEILNYKSENFNY